MEKGEKMEKEKEKGKETESVESKEKSEKGEDERTGEETVDWTRPMSDASFMAEVKLRALRVGAPWDYVAKIVPYSSRSGGVRWRFGQKPPKEREWIKRRGGWLSDAYRYYERLTPGREALEAMGLDAAELAGSLRVRLRGRVFEGGLACLEDVPSGGAAERAVRGARGGARAAGERGRAEAVRGNR